MFEFSPPSCHIYRKKKVLFRLTEDSKWLISLTVSINACLSKCALRLAGDKPSWDRLQLTSNPNEDKHLSKWTEAFIWSYSILISSDLYLCYVAFTHTHTVHKHSNRFPGAFAPNRLNNKSRSVVQPWLNKRRRGVVALWSAKQHNTFL